MRGYKALNKDMSTSYGNMILSRWVKTIQGHSVKTSTLEKAER